MKQQITTTVFRAIGMFSLASILAVQAIILVAQPAQAGQITTRSLTLLAGDNNTDGANGGSLAGRSVRHRFTFTLPSTANVGSVVIQYCTTAADVGALTCVGPTGLSTSTASLDATGNSGLTGLTPVSVDANNLRLTRAPGAAQAITAGTVVTITLNNVINPSTENTTFFARLSTYASTDGTGSPIDSGTVAASTTKAIDLSGIMPESLVFCTGDVIPLGAGNVPNCTDPAITNTIRYNQLFSPVDTATATSQMAASTNAGFGYAITVNGPTLTSGGNTIAPIGPAAPDTSKKGVSQFGLNLAANITTTTDPFGLDITPVSDGLTFNGQPTADYASPELFKFVDGETIANSGGKGTDSQIFTVSYIANVPGSLPAGTYATTLTYICTPTY